MAQLNAIYNANVYIDGNNLLGKASEITAPEVEYTMDEVTGLVFSAPSSCLAAWKHWNPKLNGTASIPKWLRVVKIRLKRCS